MADSNEDPSLPPDDHIPYGSTWSVMLKTVGAPAAFTLAAYFAYKRFLYVPDPFSKPILKRIHLPRGKILSAMKYFRTILKGTADETISSSSSIRTREVLQNQGPLL